MPVTARLRRVKCQAGIGTQFNYLANERLGILPFTLRSLVNDLRERGKQITVTIRTVGSYISVPRFVVNKIVHYAV